MKAKLLICAVLLLSAVGAGAVSFSQANNTTYKIAERLQS